MVDAGLFFFFITLGLELSDTKVYEPVIPVGAGEGAAAAGGARAPLCLARTHLHTHAHTHTHTHTHTHSHSHTHAGPGEFIEDLWNSCDVLGIFFFYAGLASRVSESHSAERYMKHVSI